MQPHSIGLKPIGSGPFEGLLFGVVECRIGEMNCAALGDADLVRAWLTAASTAANSRSSMGSIRTGSSIHSTGNPRIRNRGNLGPRRRENQRRPVHPRNRHAILRHANRRDDRHDRVRRTPAVETTERPLPRM